MIEVSVPVIYLFLLIASATILALCVFKCIHKAKDLEQQYLAAVSERDAFVEANEVIQLELRAARLHLINVLSDSRNPAVFSAISAYFREYS